MNFLVIGMHIQGLIAAGLLAKSGHKVTIVDVEGSGYDQYHEGYKTGPVSHFPIHLSKHVIEELNLENYGFENQGDVVENPFQSLPLYDDLKRLLNIFRMIEKNCPPYQEKGWRDAWNAFEIGRLLAEESSDLQELFAKLAKLSLVEFLDQHGDKAGMTDIWTRSLLGSKTDPTAKETAISVLQAMEQYEPEPDNIIVKGSYHALMRSLKEAAMASGASVKMDISVKTIEIEGNDIKGVHLTDDQILSAEHYIIDCDPVALFTNYTPGYELPPALRNSLLSENNISASVRIKMALSNSPEALDIKSVILPKQNGIVESHKNFMAEGRSKMPVLSIVNVTHDHESFSPEGTASLDVFAQYFDPTIEADDEVAQIIIKTMENIYPDIKDNILAYQINRASYFDGMADFVGAMPLLRIFKIFSGYHALAYDLPLDNAVMIGYGPAAPSHYHIRNAGYWVSDLYSSG